MNLKATYNKIAKDWYNEINANHWWEKGLHAFVGFLRKGDSVLDVGCGPGITAKYFIKHGLDVLGIDFSEKMIEIAKKEAPQGKFLIMDLGGVGNMGGVFDGIYLQNVLIHIPKKEIEHVLKNVAALLKKSGYMYICVKEKPEGSPEEYIKIDNDYGYTIKRFFSLFTKEEMKQYLDDLDFKMVYLNIVQAGKTHWIQVIGQKN